MLGRIAVALETADVTATARALREHGLWGHGVVPREVDVDYNSAQASADWIERYAGAGRTVAAFFDADANYYLVTHSDEHVNAAFDFKGSPTELVELLSEVPFHVASFETLHDAWRTRGSSYPGATSFGGHHFRHGWACAFQGSGHHSLVSRRWLRQDCWQVHRGPNDTTLVQFHDLNLDASAALAQAKPGHRRMGIADEGGFLQKEYVYANDVRGFYDAERRVLEVVVLGRTVSPVEMLDACAARRYQILGPEKPLDNVAFVLLDPSEARAHLPRLWLYGLECWTIVDEVKTRLDTEEPPEGVDDLT
ncbi:MULTISPECIES: hypothetical protein [unclassified Streptomyces]|uniref:hypothetical protein n=1 Tax=unclassified Streptomyces TaxID=2593676 RepID=UPI00336AD412